MKNIINNNAILILALFIVLISYKHDKIKREQEQRAKVREKFAIVKEIKVNCIDKTPKEEITVKEVHKTR